jgi:TATA-box binding protein (TBP) (component of TFIID and TFIIIB)
MGGGVINMDVVKLNSDYDPDTFIRITNSDDGEITVGVYGKGEFVIAGLNGGSQLESTVKIKLINAFRQIIYILQEA